MKPRDVFGIIVRVFGLALAFYAIWYFIYGIATLAGMPEDEPGYLTAYFLSGGFCLVMGLYLLRGAPALIRFSYPGKEKSESESENPQP